MPSESSGKRFVFEYLSQNSLQFNELSLADAIGYLISALEVERLNTNWYNFGLKALFEVLYSNSYLSFAFASKTCVTEVFNRHFVPYLITAIEVACGSASRVAPASTFKGIESASQRPGRSCAILATGGITSASMRSSSRSTTKTATSGARRTRRAPKTCRLRWTTASSSPTS